VTNIELLTNTIQQALPGVTIQVRDGNVQAYLVIKNVGERLVGCSVLAAEARPQEMAERIIQTFRTTNWTNLHHVFCAALIDPETFTAQTPPNPK
jgi:hypothetical protein